MAEEDEENGDDKKPNVDAWVEKQTQTQIKALQHSSQDFDDDDQFTVHTLEAMYGQESCFHKRI